MLLLIAWMQIPSYIAHPIPVKSWIFFAKIPANYSYSASISFIAVLTVSAKSSLSGNESR